MKIFSIFVHYETQDETLLSRWLSTEVLSIMVASKQFLGIYPIGEVMGTFFIDSSINIKKEICMNRYHQCKCRRTSWFDTTPWQRSLCATLGLNREEIYDLTNCKESAW